MQLRRKPIERLLIAVNFIKDTLAILLALALFDLLAYNFIQQHYEKINADLNVFYAFAKVFLTCI